jgi:hypothetical protein
LAPSTVGALAKPAITRTFEIINLTSSRQMLIGWTAQANRTVVQVPPVGSIMEPGESKTIVLTQYSFQDLEGTAEFAPVDASGVRTISPTVFRVIVATRPFGSVWGCYNNGGAGRGNCDNGTTRTVVLLDPPGTVISVPSGQGQKQADALNAFCSTGRATCSFVPRSYNNRLFSPPKQASDSFFNNTTTPADYSRALSNAQSTSTNLKLSTKVEGKIFDLVSVAVTAEAGQTWTSTNTFTTTIKIVAQPGQEVWFATSAPLKSVTGDFFVTFGNSRWNLYDLTFTSPDVDPDRFVRWTACTATTCSSGNG